GDLLEGIAEAGGGRHGDRLGRGAGGGEAQRPDGGAVAQQWAGARQHCAKGVQWRDARALTLRKWGKYRHRSAFTLYSVGYNARSLTERDGSGKWICYIVAIPFVSDHHDHAKQRFAHPFRRPGTSLDGGRRR